MTKTKPQRIYPGLVCRSIEFFLMGDVLKVISKGSVKDFRDAPWAYHQILKEAVKKEPETNKLLKEWYPKSEMKRLVQFGSCRFGGLDFYPDVNQSRLQAGEYSECPVRNSCPGAGIICRTPKYKGAEISFLEVDIIKALSTTDTNENIAAKIPLPLGSFHLAKKTLYRKLRIQTKQEAVMIGRDLNLI